MITLNLNKSLPEALQDALAAHLRATGGVFSIPVLPRANHPHRRTIDERVTLALPTRIVVPIPKPRTVTSGDGSTAENGYTVTISFERNAALATFGDSPLSLAERARDAYASFTTVDGWTATADVPAIQPGSESASDPLRETATLSLIVVRDI